MRSTIQQAVAGLSLLSGVLAAPAGAPSYAAPAYTFVKASGSATAVYASTSTLVPNSFPDLSDAQLKQVEQLAHGTEPSTAPPPSLSEQGGINFQLVEFNENFEVAFFTSFINNITNDVPGFELQDKDEKNFIVTALTAHLNQEIEHAFNARGSLKHFGRTTIDPCKYKFPTTTGEDATKLATKFTDVTLGTLQDVSVIFAENGDTGAPGAVASVIGQEGEQNGFYRLLQNNKLIPAPVPFLTRSTRDFAFSALQGFVDGHCDGSKSSPVY
jgi:hypothetical protein